MVAIQDKLVAAKDKMSVDPVAATADLKEFIELAKEAGEIVGEAEARHLLSQLYFHAEQNIEAIEEVKKAIALRESNGDLAGASMSLNNMGIYLTRIADYSAALESCFKALKIREELNDKRRIAVTLINIGSIYHHTKNASQEMKMYERALEIADEIRDQRLITSLHLNMGGLYGNTAHYELAFKFLDKLDEKFLSDGDKLNAIHAINTQGFIFHRSEQYDKALERYSRCLDLSRETGNMSHIIISLMNIAELKINTGQTEEAKNFIDEAVKLSEQHALKPNLRDTKLVLSDYYSSRQDYKNALKEFREHIVLKDELLNKQSLKQFGELHLKYDLEKKEKEAQINHLKNVELRQAMDKLQDEKNRSDNLLLNILPEEVAEELKATGTAKAKYFELVTVMFIDIKNFTVISQQLSAEMLVHEIDHVFRNFDRIIQRYDVEKIKTIGDAYMCAGGLPVPDINNAEKVTRAAIEIMDFMAHLKEKRMIENKPFFEIRIGLNTGPVVAGIVGSSKFAYDIWGDTVNTAARMEQTGEVGKINISGSTWILLQDKFDCSYRGKISAKNKGEIDMYFLTSKNSPDG